MLYKTVLFRLYREPHWSYSFPWYGYFQMCFYTLVMFAGLNWMIVILQSFLQI